MKTTLLSLLFMLAGGSENNQIAEKMQIFFQLHSSIAAKQLQEEKDGTLRRFVSLKDEYGQERYETVLNFKEEKNAILNFMAEIVLDTTPEGYSKWSNKMDVGFCEFKYGECTDEVYGRFTKTRVYTQDNIYTEKIILPNGLEIIITDKVYINRVDYKGTPLIRVGKYQFE